MIQTKNKKTSNQTGKHTNKQTYMFLRLEISQPNQVQSLQNFQEILDDNLNKSKKQKQIFLDQQYLSQIKTDLY